MDDSNPNSNTTTKASSNTSPDPIFAPWKPKNNGKTLLMDILGEGVSRGLLPGRTLSARKWFRDTARQLNAVNPRELMMSDDVRYRNTIYPGRMYLFYYDPKMKKTLPYYDRFPLIFPIEPYKDGSFLGINLHYLPPPLRARLMDALYATLNNVNFDHTTRLNISYRLLKSTVRMREFKPCVKRYLMSHVRSRFISIPAEQWDIALFLPCEQFEKASAGKVWTDSRNKIWGTTQARMNKRG